MDNSLPKLYQDYGNYANYRTLPLDIDGLKPVERRVLLSAYKIARGKFAKSRQVDAYTIGHYHPHGSTYGTIVQLVRQEFLDGQGNFGSIVGVEPIAAAADRYTECKINQNTVDLAFKYLDYVPWVDTELSDREPAFLPTMIPICLMGTEYTQGIGFGYKTLIPCYKAKDLFARLEYLLGIRKRKVIIEPISDCNITSPPEVLEKLLTSGSARIDLEGVIQINKIKNIAVVNSWPPGKRFESFLNKFSKELNEGLVGFTDLSTDHTEIVFQVLRERNRDKIFSEFVEKLKEVVKGSINFEITVTDIKQKVMTKSVDQLLLDTYEMFTTANENMLKDKIEKIKETIDEYDILERIKKPLSSCIQSGLDVDKAVQKISELTKIEENVIQNLLEKYRIKKLLTLNTDTSHLKDQKKETEDNLKNIKEFVLEQYSSIK